MESAADLPSRGVTMRVKNPVAAVRSFARKCQPGAMAVKLGSPVNQLLNPGGPFFYKNVRRFGVDNAVSCINRVLKVKTDLIFITQGHCDAALRIMSCGFCNLLLRQHQDLATFGQRNG